MSRVPRKHTSITMPSALVLLSISPAMAQQTRMMAPAPISRLHYETLKASDPAFLQTLTHAHIVAAGAPQKRAASSVWQPLSHQPNFAAMTPLLLTDGSVMVGDEGGSADGGSGTSWFKLTPDINGSYINGTWTQLADMQPGYEPLYFASAILPDGRVIVEGGEYNNFDAVWSGQGAIYDPIADTWTPVSPPAGMSQTSSIGDANGMVLENGTFMLSPVYTPASGPQQLLDEQALSWTATGQNNKIGNDEASQSLLQNGLVLTTAPYKDKQAQAAVYHAKTGKWTTITKPPVQLWDSNQEIGPQVTMLDGSIFAFGSTLGHTAIYKNGTWTIGPDMPVIKNKQYGMADAPAAVLPSGKILAMGGPGYAVKPSHFFVYDGTGFTQTDDTPDSPQDPNFVGHMLVLPTGQIMLTDLGNDIEIYTDPAAPTTGAAPTNIKVPKTLSVGPSYTLRGDQLGGVTQGSAYGDDYQSATNYPIVRITNNASKHVFYARTFDFSKMEVEPNAPSTAKFTLPAGIESGKSQLVVVASGFASSPVAVTVKP
jgi:hypothetical protein